MGQEYEEVKEYEEDRGGLNSRARQRPILNSRA